MVPLRMIVVAVIFSACHPEPYVCPVQEPVKLKYASVNRMKMYKRQLREMASERKETAAEREQWLKVNKWERKKAIDIDEWDCPKPGDARSKMIRKQRLKLEKQHDLYLRKKAEQVDEGKSN